MRLRKLNVFILSASIAFATTCAIGQSTLNNDAILKMHAAGLSDDLLVTTINSQPGTYSTSTDDMIALKKAGLGDKVIAAMISKGASPAPTLVPGPAPAPAQDSFSDAVSDVGAYYKDPSGNWQELKAEIVNWKTGGVLKSIATDGIVKGDVNGNIKGGQSSLVVSAPVDIVVHVSEGNQIGEYQLLHLHSHSHDREFRTITGGVFHESSGAQRDVMQFESRKIGSHLYEIQLPATVEPGEYGILPPGEGVSGSKNIASSGKIYTFSIGGNTSQTSH